MEETTNGICLTCGREIDESHGFPNGAVIFTSYGNYGSRAFDTMHGPYMRALVCDECIEKYGDRISMIRETRPRPERTRLGTYTEWDAAERERLAKAVSEE